MVVRRWLAAIAIALLSGCVQPATPVPDLAQTPNESTHWTVVGHAEGDIALRASFRVTAPRLCTLFFALHYELQSITRDSSFYYEFESGGVLLEGIDPGTRPIGGGHAQYGDVDTQAATDPIGQLASQAYYGQDTFTAWIGYPDRSIEPGDYNLTVTGLRALDKGDQTLGGSARASLACDGPAILLGAMEDRNTLLVTEGNMAGEADALVDPQLVSYHRGSQAHAAYGTQTEWRVDHHAQGHFEGRLAIDGPSSRQFDWTEGGSPDMVRNRWVAPPGNYTLEWDLLAIAGGIAIRAQSFSVPADIEVRQEATFPF